MKGKKAGTGSLRLFCHNVKNQCFSIHMAPPHNLPHCIIRSISIRDWLYSRYPYIADGLQRDLHFSICLKRGDSGVQQEEMKSEGTQVMWDLAGCDEALAVLWLGWETLVASKVSGGVMRSICAGKAPSGSYTEKTLEWRQPWWKFK